MTLGRIWTLHDAEVGRADGFGAHDVFARADGEGLAADEAGGRRPGQRIR